jgi:6-pyruvoyltetrahydropterin/6-carboxytetrahydropterin synthase
MFEISIQSHFCGAHQLKGYHGPCERMHGHNWEVEIFLKGLRINHLGILLDFQHAKEFLQAVLSKIDHQNLNELAPFKKENPSAENIARYVFNEIARKIKGTRVRIQRVRVSETPGTAAWYGRSANTR